MKSYRSHLSVLLILLFLSLPVLVTAQEKRTALVIGNSDYTDAPLRNPVNDATDMAETLKKLGFSVTLKTNANQRTMEEAIRDFGRSLRSGGVGLFYFAGHGLQVHGRNYLIPISSNIETESEAKYEAVDAGRVLGQMEDAGNDLNIIILDACRNNPFARSFRSAERGLAKMDAPTGSILAYSTAPGSVAADGVGRNGLYTEKLLKFITSPGIKIEDVFKNVRIEVASSTGKQQIPWESSSLMGDFYFNPKRGIAVVQPSSVEPQRPTKEIKKYSSVSPSILEPGVVARDGRFVAYGNGTVKDTETGLMWAAKDNGEDINWNDAKRYCESYRGGGYTDWRMPTRNEYVGLYDRSKSYKATQKNINVCLTELIELSAPCPWITETRGSEAAYFNFASGGWAWYDKSNPIPFRVLPVRNDN
jgi:hypothetical protein